mgnify:CR=1 FL=1
MKPRFRALLLTLALFGLAPGCRSEELVELRLFPCEFAGIEPRSVTVEITGFDAAGQVVETFEVPFDDIAASTFADGYASVGYRKSGQVVRARFRVGWFEAAVAGPIAEADAIAVYDELEVPDPGEVLELTKLVGDCAELIAEGTDTGSTTMDTSSSTTMDTSSSDTLDTTSSTTMDTSSSDTMDTTTDTSTDTTDTGDPPGPMVGDACSVGFAFSCVGGPTPEDAGTPLICDDASMMLETTALFPVACGGSCIDNLATPVDACRSIGDDAKCMCLSPDAPDCAGAMLGCVDPDQLHLCFEGKVVVGGCPSCATTPEGWFTCG